MTLAIEYAGCTRTVRFTVVADESLEGSVIVTKRRLRGATAETLPNDPTYTNSGRTLTVDVPVTFDDDEPGRWTVTCDVDSASGDDIVYGEQHFEIFPQT